MWIDKQEKKQYSDCPVHGLRLKFYEGISQTEKEDCLKFCNWLRKNYWFPIRIRLDFIPQKKFRDPQDGHYYYGIFYSNKESRRKIYPRIFIATQIKNQSERNNVFFTVAHELTHYYQWYFYEDERKSIRSLEISANKWAYYILSEYQETI